MARKRIFSDKERKARHCEASKQYRKENPDKISKANREWKQEHPQAHRQHSKNWRARHRGTAHRSLASPAERKERRAERARQRARQYQSEHPEQMRAKEAKRRALKKGNGGSYTADELRALFEQYGNQCIGPGPHSEGLEADHVIPVSKPGGTSYISNIQPLCGLCNSRKGTRVIDYRG